LSVYLEVRENKETRETELREEKEFREADEKNGV
jgi:hypothetical protein